MMMHLKAPSPLRPSIHTVTPQTLKHVFAIPELVDQILQYVSPSDIGSLRRTSWILWNVCTNASPIRLWFYKDLNVAYKGEDFFDMDNGYSSIPDRWGLRTARFIRSITLDLPRDLLCGPLWDFGDRAVAKCPNISELSYLNVKVMMMNWQDLILDGQETSGTHATRIARQVAIVASRLKTLRLKMGHYERHPTQLISDEIVLWDTDEHDLIKWMQAVDRMLECIILSTGYMTLDTTLPLRQTFSCLQILSLSGSKRGELRMLEWDTLMACLQMMPILRELELIRIKLLPGSLGNIIDFSTILDRRRAYIYHDNKKASPIFGNLRKLTVTVSLCTEMISKIDRAFPKIRALSVCSPVGTDRASSIPPHSDSQTAWEFSRSFPYLSRLQLCNGNTTETMDLEGFLLPRSLTDFHFEHHGSFNLPGNITSGPTNHPIWFAEPGTFLKQLCMKINDNRICQDMLSREWCRHLTSLSLSNGAIVIRELLSNRTGPPSAPEAGNPLPLVGDENWTFDHLQESFVQSKLAFFPFLRSLHLGGRVNEVMSDAKALYINRLLQLMPLLQEFSTDDLLNRYQMLFYRLGRTHYTCKAATATAAAAAATAGPLGTPQDPLNHWEIEKPSLRSLVLNPSSKINIRQAEDDLRQQFPFLTDFTWKNPPNPPPSAT